ncbi:hypothetical protein [Caballeronia sp. SBC2]|uniref:hypothetical protein n=1 Tax=Caballeronia sp. SBC2 TaxID=2705547 RepID=UPI0013E12DF1|nr:hypothetical protein [Caballeronia sp. SBC2]QIE30275.1 hypothetical protein SBC2_83510 [Caballeronia sp. SBC2]
MPDNARLPLLLPLTDEWKLALHVGRFDERQRHQRLRLPTRATCWDYASLIDVVRKDPGSGWYRFTGKTASQWMAELRARCATEYEIFRKSYEATVTRQLGVLNRRPRLPDNHYCAEIAIPPLRPSLPRLIHDLGLNRASVEQWLATLRALTRKRLKAEELEMSGILSRLSTMPPGSILAQAQVIALVDVKHLTPRMASESRFSFVTTAGWKEVCERIPEKDYKRRGRLGAGHGAMHLIRYRHRSLGWAIVRCRYRDLFTERTDWWGVLDERGRFIDQSAFGFDSPEHAIKFAEFKMSRRFSSWGKDNALSKWERFSLPGGDGYREIILTLDDWPGTYRSPHYRTRNILVHIRTSVRHTQDGRRVLFLDEIQSDWHADLHAQSKAELPEHGSTEIPRAPFRKEWPLLSMKLMIWWAQRLGVDGVAWSSLELQRTRWGAFASPEILYSKILPDAASSLAATLPIELDRTQLSVRSISRRVRFGKHGWEVRNRAGTPVTKSFRTRAQAERFADLTGVFFNVDLPVLWICRLPPIKSIPLYGTEDAEAWFGRCERRNPLSEMSGDTESENCAR